MKTPEEIKQSVLKECEMLCPKVDSEIRTRLWLLRDFDGFNCLRQNKANQGTQIFHVSPSMDADDPYWDVAYSVLNIEARELEERAQGLVDALEEIVTSNGYGEGVGAEFQAIAETALNQWKGGGK